MPVAGPAQVVIGEMTVNNVTGNYINHGGVNVAGTVLSGPYNYPPTSTHPPQNIYCEEPQTLLGLSTPASPLRPRRQPQRGYIPFPATSQSPNQEQCPPPQDGLRAYKRKRTSGSRYLGPQDIPGAQNIGTVHQTFHVHTRSGSNTPPVDRLLKYVAIGAIHDSFERQHAPKCHGNTRRVVRDEIRTWAKKDGGDETALWMTGPAGTGKTAIAGTVADECHKDKTLAACFFFSSLSEDPARSTTNSFISTLAYQLIQHGSIVGLKEEVLAAIDNDPHIFEKCVASQLESLILAPLRRVHERSESDPSTWPNLIIVDGIDECRGVAKTPSPHLKHKAGCDQASGHEHSDASNEVVYKEIISTLLRAVNDRAFPFRILVVSRPEPVIRNLINANPNTARELFLGTKYKPDADIALFLEAGFSQLQEDYDLPANWPGEAVVKKLVRNASGQFVYAATVMGVVESGNKHPEEQLELILAWDDDDQPGESPLARLDELYTHIINTTPDPLRVVTWLHAILELHAESNDSHITVKAFLESRPGETEFLLRSLSSLLSIANNGRPFRFFHKSFLDFLASPKRSGKLYVGPKTVAGFLQGRWYELLKNRGPQIPLTAPERRVFLRHYVESLTMRYFYLPGKGSNYTPTDVSWWTDVCFELLTSRCHQLRVEGVHEIAHESCSGPWLFCDSDCSMWRKNLRTPTYRQMLYSNSRRKTTDGRK